MRRQVLAAMWAALAYALCDLGIIGEDNPAVCISQALHFRPPRLDLRPVNGIGKGKNGFIRVAQKLLEMFLQPQGVFKFWVMLECDHHFSCPIVCVEYRLIAPEVDDNYMAFQQ